MKAKRPLVIWIFDFIFYALAVFVLASILNFADSAMLALNQIQNDQAQILSNQKEIEKSQTLTLMILGIEYQETLEELNRYYDELNNDSLYEITEPERMFGSDLLGYNWFTPEHEKLLRAISFVESGHDPNAIGDNGNALGSFQIWNVYWKDAVEHSPEIGGSYQDVKDPDYAREVVLAYWDRYGKRCGYSLEGLARIHNGGPTGHKKDATISYWNKVKSQLDTL